jgi:transcription initiation factor IIF auxiliary subunit
MRVSLTLVEVRNSSLLFSGIDAATPLVIDKPPFEVTETGWGEFEIQIRVAFSTESGEKPITLFHVLKLHGWQIVKNVVGKSCLSDTINQSN